MRLTNRLNLPASIVAAIANDSYKGGGDISVTKLITPPYQRKLLAGRGQELVEDAADRIWSLMGQIGHAIVERVKLDPLTSVAEERLFMDVWDSESENKSLRRGISVSGQFDLIESGVLTDFKFTSVWSRDGKDEWIQQLNLLRVLCEQHRLKTGDQRYLITKLQIIAVFRDWTKAKVGIGDYPSSQVAVINIPLWPLEQAQQYMTERVALHFADHPQPCTDEDRWMSPEVYALMKDGRKSALKLYQDKGAAEAAAALKGKGHTVIHRPAEYKRCADYCAVSPFCPEWQKVIQAAPF